MKSPALRDPFLRLMLVLLLLVLVCLGMPGAARAAAQSGDVTLQSRYWIDPTGQAGIDEVAQKPLDELEPLTRYRAFQLDEAAMWMRFDLPALDAEHRWYLLLDAAAFSDLATFYQAGPSGWRVQRAGDHLPVSQWSIPDRSPVFALEGVSEPRTVWLRVANKATPLSPRLYVLTESELQHKRHWTYLMLGGYLGFGLLVMFLGWVHARLYADRAFVAYVAYVACMLGFQAAFTGLGGVFFWPDSPWWNNAAPAVFMLWLTATGIWFVREVCAVSRYHRSVDRFVLAWSLFGLLYPAVYLALGNSAAFLVLNLYGLFSVLLSFSLCLWTWRLGEKYAGWLVLGFLPVHLGYPFPALRGAGLLPDSWATQYAVLIGSAVEIPLLLYILHRRAKEFNENRARMRALDSSDPLTGLTVVPVMHLRLRDAMRRARRYGHQCGLLLVELSNHSEMVAVEGREAGDRALVLGASRLSRVVRDVDTVCRVANTRFAILVEGPLLPDELKLLAQHIVAKGLERASTLPGDWTPRFRMVSAMLPSADFSGVEGEDMDVRRFVGRLHKALDRLGEEPNRMVLHLPLEPQQTAPQVAVAA